MLTLLSLSRPYAASIALYIRTWQRHTDVFRLRFAVVLLYNIIFLELFVRLCWQTGGL